LELQQDARRLWTEPEIALEEVRLLELPPEPDTEAIEERRLVVAAALAGAGGNNTLVKLPPPSPS